MEILFVLPSCNVWAQAVGTDISVLRGQGDLLHHHDDTSIIINRPYGLDSIVRLKLPKTFDDVGTFAPIPAPKQFSGQGSWQRHLFPGRGEAE